MKLKWRSIVVALYTGNLTIPKTAINTEAESVPEFGWREPIVADRSRMIVSGHTKWVPRDRSPHHKRGLSEEDEQ
jgi:hypothetical protein